jgi:hypothetical protein
MATIEANGSCNSRSTKSGGMTVWGASGYSACPRVCHAASTPVSTFEFSWNGRSQNSPSRVFWPQQFAWAQVRTTMADDEDERQILARPLQVIDIPFVVALKEASFPPNEAATLEKVGNAKRGNCELTAAYVPNSNLS